MTPEEEIKQLKQEVERLKGLAYKDELTGLYNRRGFTEEAGHFLKELEAQKEHEHKRESIFIRSFSIVLFDLDNFKEINDTYGHEVGDKALKLFSDVINARVREIDIVGRWGGEEIIVALVGATKEEAQNTANRIREDLEEAEMYVGDSDTTVKFTVSGGVAGFKDTNELSGIIDAADKALYSAKDQGKNQIVLY